VYDDNPQWIATYWKAWELALKNLHEPEPGSGFVSQYIDAAFNDKVYLWDSSFMTMFMNYGAPLVPGISTLDNFYARQHEDGEICREMIRATGACWAPWVNRECGPLSSRFGWSGERFKDLIRKLEIRNAALKPDPRIASVGTIDNPFMGWVQSASLQGTLSEDDPQLEHPLNLPTPLAVTYRGRSAPNPNPVFTLEALNNPIAAWAEVESYRVTGNKDRLKSIWEPLVRYYDTFQTYLKQGNGLYVTDFTSMDNSPRNHYLDGGGTAVDTSSQMALFARNLAEIADILGMPRESRKYATQANAVSRVINRQMWDRTRHFYFDLRLNGGRDPVKTVAAFWTLVGRVPSASQSKYLAQELNDPKTFGRPNAVPTLAGDEPSYNPKGGYWSGAVWAPTTTMVIRGLEAYGYQDLARRIALQHLNLVADVYRKTGTIWENYSPEKFEPGDPAKADFVGWSGIGPILYLLEYGIG